MSKKYVRSNIRTANNNSFTTPVKESYTPPATPKGKKGGAKTYLLITACVLGLAVVGMGVFFLLPGMTSSGVVSANYVVEEFTVPGSVTVAGVDLSGMNRVEAYNKVMQLGLEFENKSSIDIEMGGETVTFTPQELGVTSNTQEIADKIKSIGAVGSFGERQKALEEAEQGLSFDFELSSDESLIRQGITKLAELYEREPQDASVTFDINAQEKFTYTESVEGIKINKEELVAMVSDSVKNKTFDKLVAPVNMTPPEISLEVLKENTVLIASHKTNKLGGSAKNPNRVFNITKMAGIVNGTVIKPGETWSINAAAGERTAANGWKQAAAIVGGRLEDEDGGGVCQVSGTLYNAALMAELTITERIPHSIPSTYVPKGLDATITLSNGANKDLKLTNPYDFPVYLVAYVKGDELTCEVYGKQLPYKISFKSETVSTEPFTTEYIQGEKLPDGTLIPYGETMKWRSGQNKQTVQVTKTYTYPDGTKKSEKFGGPYTYRAISEQIYTNGGYVEYTPES